MADYVVTSALIRLSNRLGFEAKIQIQNVNLKTEWEWYSVRIMYYRSQSGRIRFFVLGAQLEWACRDQLVPNGRNSDFK